MKSERLASDTNVLSELRKGKRCNAGVSKWFIENEKAPMYTSVITVGEIRYGIERLRKRDEVQAVIIERWLTQIEVEFSDENILPITRTIADMWGRINSNNPLPAADSLIAATALIHNLTVVTRNTKDFEQINVACINPFE